MASLVIEHSSLHDLRNKQGLNKQSKILFINTDGDTGHVHYREII